MKVVVVERGRDDYYVYIEGKPQIWGCGRTRDAAIGDLVRTHRNVFGIVEIVIGDMPLPTSGNWK